MTALDLQTYAATHPDSVWDYVREFQPGDDVLLEPASQPAIRGVYLGRTPDGAVKIRPYSAIRHTLADVLVIADDCNFTCYCQSPWDYYPRTETRGYYKHDGLCGYARRTHSENEAQRERNISGACVYCH